MRIVFAQLPQMLRELLVKSLKKYPDLVLAGVAEDEGELRRLVEQRDIDVILVGVPDEELAVSHFGLFNLDPRIRLVAIIDHGRSALLYELYPQRTVLGEGSPADLLRSISEVAAFGGFSGPCNRRD